MKMIAALEINNLETNDIEHTSGRMELFYWPDEKIEALFGDN